MNEIVMERYVVILAFYHELDWGDGVRPQVRLVAKPSQDLKALTEIIDQSLCLVFLDERGRKIATQDKAQEYVDEALL